MLVRSSSSNAYGATRSANNATRPIRTKTTRLITASLWRKKRILAYAHWLRGFGAMPAPYASASCSLTPASSSGVPMSAGLSADCACE